MLKVAGGISGGATGALVYQGAWDAAANNPTLTSGVGTKGYYYVVSVAGTTNLDGITNWAVGDWAVFNGTVWQKVDGSNLGTMAYQNASSVTITGGTIDSVTENAATYNNVTINSGNATLTTANATYVNISSALRTQSLTGYLYGNANTGNVSASTTIPNAGLTNSSITLGNATLTLGGTTTSVGNLTLANANVTSVASTFPNSYLANSSATLGNATITLGSTTTSVGNLTLTNVTINSGSISNVAIGAAITTKTTGYTATTSDETVLANASTGVFNVTLPTAVGATGKIYVIKKIDSTANVVTVNTTSSQTIDGALTRALSYQYDAIQVQTDGANWFIIANTFGRNGTAGTF